MKKLNVKKAAVIGMCCAMISTSTVFAISDNLNISNKIKVNLNNEWLQMVMEPFIEKDRSLVPLKDFVEQLEANVSEDLEKGVISIYTNDIIIEMSIEKSRSIIKRNEGGSLKEETVNLEVSPKIVDGTVFVPVRFIAETLGYNVQWDNYKRAIVIRNEGDIISVERPMEFEIVDKDLIESNALLLNLYEDNYKTKGIYSLMDGEYIYVLVSAGERPTGGYSLEIDSITEVVQGTAYIHATLNSPSKDSIVTQVLTYPNVMVKFNKDDINNIQWDLSGDIQLDEAEKREVIKFVQDFGEQLKMVSLLAPEEVLKDTMTAYYGNYVSDELIEKWLNDPATAPGRLTSSPWPGRIDVLSIEKTAENEYMVNGNIVEFTSVEVEEGGIAAKRFITLKVIKVEDKWVIVSAELGDYEED